LQALLDDLVDFNRTNLGLGISVVPSPLESWGESARKNWATARCLCRDASELEVEGDCQGFWDGRRVRQVLVT
jgi:hypothetical protein